VEVVHVGTRLGLGRGRWLTQQSWLPSTSETWQAKYRSAVGLGECLALGLVGPDRLPPVLEEGVRGRTWTGWHGRAGVLMDWASIRVASHTTFRAASVAVRGVLPREHMGDSESPEHGDDLSPRSRVSERVGLGEPFDTFLLLHGWSFTS
jgi:hypothetical protein